MTALVGPVKDVVWFHDGTVVPYTVPKDTVDNNRWRACTDHRTACDCREAELAETISELRAELNAAQDAARYVLAGHPTWAWEDGPDGEREIGCACTGCRIARKADLLHGGDGNTPHARDRVHGLHAFEVAAGLHWRVCTRDLRERHPACQTLRTRHRAHCHEHILDADGNPQRNEPDGGHS